METRPLSGTPRLPIRNTFMDRIKRFFGGRTSSAVPKLSERERQGIRWRVLRKRYGLRKLLGRRPLKRAKGYTARTRARNRKADRVAKQSRKRNYRNA